MVTKRKGIRSHYKKQIKCLVVECRTRDYEEQAQNRDFLRQSTYVMVIFLYLFFAVSSAAAVGAYICIIVRLRS